MPGQTSPNFVAVNLKPDPEAGHFNATISNYRDTLLRIETTNHCNFKCTFCPHPDHTREREFMDQALFESIIVEAGTLGFRKLDIRNFGEPLLDKRLPQLVTFSKRNGFSHIYMHTNGLGLDLERFNRLIESGMTNVVISIAPEREFIVTRPGTKYARLIKGIESLKDSPYKNLILIDYVNSGASSSEEIIQMWQWLESLGIGVRPELKLHNWASDDTYAQAEHWLCYRLWNSVTVLSSGQVALCCMDYNGEVILGDLTKQSLSDAVNSKAYQDIRTAHLKGQFLEKCASCSLPSLRQT